MALFTANVNNNILVAIEYVKILSGCQYGTESIVHELAQQHFGKVSSTALHIMEKTKKGMTLDDGFDSVMARLHHKNLKLFFEILKEGDIVRRATELGSRIIEERTLAVDTLIDSMSANLKRIMTIMTFPLAIFFIALLKDAMNIAGETPFNISIPENINLLIVVLDLAALAVVLLLLRYKE